MSSLALQLAAIQRTNPDAKRLASAKALKYRDSYLYSSRRAAALTLEDVHAIGLQGLEGLKELEPDFERFRNPLFGEGAKRLDRTAVPREEEQALDRHLGDFLRSVGPHLLVKPSAKALEWLIRRFRINEFNVEAVLCAFLPYHATPQFASMLQILHFSNMPHLRFLDPVKANRSPLPREHLVDALLESMPLFNFILDLLPGVLRTSPGCVHRALVGFHLTTLLALFDALVKRRPGFSAPLLGAILPALQAGVGAAGHSEVQLASYVLVAALAQRAPLSVEALQAIIKLVAASRVEAASSETRLAPSGEWSDADEALIRTLVLVFQSSDASSITLHGKPAEHISTLPGIGRLMLYLLGSFELGSFWDALVSALCAGSQNGSSFQLALLRELAQVPTLTEALARPLINALLSELATPTAAEAGAGSETTREGLLTALNTVSQRQPTSLIDASALALSSSPPFCDDPELKKSLLNLVRNVVSGALSARGELPMGVALTSGSSVVRLSALRQLLEDCRDGTIPAQKADAAQAALKAAMMDASQSMAEILLSAHPSTVIQVLGPSEALAVSRRALRAAGAELPRAVLNVHVGFWAGPLVEAARAVPGDDGPGVVADATEAIAVRLLWTKSGAKATKVVWSAARLGAEAWRETILEGVTGKVDAGKEPGSGALVQQNGLLVQNLAARLRTQPGHVVQRWIDMAATGSEEAPIHGKLLALQTLGAGAAGQLSPCLRLSAVSRILAACMDEAQDPESKREMCRNLAGMDVGEQAKQAAAEAVYSKPGSTRTASRVAAVTLAGLFVGLERPAEATEFMWLERLSGHPPEAQLFARVVLDEFALVASDAGRGSESSLSRVASGALARVLPDDALAFYASVWTTATHPAALRVAALRAATAAVSGQNRDFQLLLPPILAVISDASRDVRAAALDLAAQGSAASPQADGGQGQHVYGFEKFFGPSTGSHLQYLSLGDAKALFACLVEAREELLLDGGFAEVVLERKLGELDAAAGRKPKAGLRHRAFCFFMAALTAWSDLGARARVMECLRSVLAPTRINRSAALLSEALAHQDDAAIARSGADECMRYAAALMSAFERPTKQFLDGKDDDGNRLFFSILEHQPTTVLSRSLRDTGLEVLRKTFASFTMKLRLNVLSLLLSQGVSSRDDALVYVQCLRSLKVDGEAFTMLLGSFADAVPTKPSKANKKTKMNSGAPALGTAAVADDVLPSLALALENVSTEEMQHSASLVKALVRALGVLIEAQSHTRVDVHFMAQLTISALASVIAKMQMQDEGSSLEAIELRPIVDYMRVCPNPHVAQQAISVIADIAVVAPNQAIHSIMPILTFVGANVLQRDDASSARTVEKVVQSLVPPMVEATKKDNLTRNETVLRLRELVMVFVGASGHIPRHRRSRVFMALLEALGPYTFLGAVLMLLVNTDVGDATDRTNLALQLWESFPCPLGLAALAHITAEVETLLGQGGSEAASILFAEEVDHDGDVGMDDNSSSPAARNVRAECAQQLLVFVARALASRSLASKLNAARSAGNDEGDAVLSHFLRLMVDLGQPYTTISADQQAEMARELVQHAARLMSVSALSDSLLRLLASQDDRLVYCAFDLLCHRLPEVKHARRAELEPACKAALRASGDVVQQHLRSPQQAVAPIVPLSLAIGVVIAAAQGATAPEQVSLGSLHAPLLELAQQTEDAKILGLVLHALDLISRCLGPRIISGALESIGVFAALVRRSLADGNAGVACACLVALEGVVSAIPTFVGASMHQLMLLLVEVAAAADVNNQRRSRGLLESRSSLVATIVKSVGLPDLLEAVTSVWSAQPHSLPGLVSLLDTLNRALKRAKPAEVAQVAKPTFSLVLLTLDVRRLRAHDLSGDSVVIVENAALTAFMSLALKLSEAAFKPLLLRAIDWATVELDAGPSGSAAPASMSRQVVLFRLFHKLLAQLKAIAVPFTAFILDHIVVVLESFAAGRLEDTTLWTPLASVLSNALEHDSTDFWTMQRLGKITPPVLAQLGRTAALGEGLTRSHLVPLIARLAAHASSHDALFKVLNGGILRLLRTSEDLRVKRACLAGLDRLWAEMGEALVPFIPETIGGGLAEALEEPEGGVEQAARDVLRRIEAEVGDIQGYLA